MITKSFKGHTLALITVFVWGITFVSTKVLLTDFTPIEILFFRFFISLIVLFVIYPKTLKLNNKKEELLFAFAGLCGITLYYLLENIALTLTLVSNVGVIVAISPFLTALVAGFFFESERPKRSFFIGFSIAIIGIGFISFNRQNSFGFSLKGDLLAVLAAIVWAFYSTAVLKISSYGYNTILVTRRIFSYGILFMIPALFIFDFSFNLSRFLNPVYMFNIIFLGVGAGAICFISWNLAVKFIGAVKTSAYIYLVPIVTVIFSALILGERLSGYAIFGVCLTLFGLILPEIKIKRFTRKR